MGSAGGALNNAAQKEVAKSIAAGAGGSPETFAQNVVNQIYEMGRSAGQQAAAGGAADQEGVEHLDLLALTRQNGVFRGVKLLAGASDLPLRRVLQFTPRATKLSEEDTDKKRDASKSCASLD